MILFQQELENLVRTHQYDLSYIQRVVRTPAELLSEEAQWLQLVAIQSALEYYDIQGMSVGNSRHPRSH